MVFDVARRGQGSAGRASSRPQIRRRARPRAPARPSSCPWPCAHLRAVQFPVRLPRVSCPTAQEGSNNLIPEAGTGLKSGDLSHGGFRDDQRHGLRSDFEVDTAERTAHVQTEIPIRKRGRSVRLGLEGSYPSVYPRFDRGSRIDDGLLKEEGVSCCDAPLFPSGCGCHPRTSSRESSRGQVRRECGRRELRPSPLRLELCDAEGSRYRGRHLHQRPEPFQHGQRRLDRQSYPDGKCAGKRRHQRGGRQCANRVLHGDHRRPRDTAGHARCLCIRFCKRVGWRSRRGWRPANSGQLQPCRRRGLEHLRKYHLRGCLFRPPAVFQFAGDASSAVGQYALLRQYHRRR